MNNALRARMMIRKNFQLPVEEIAQLCGQFSVRELALFGSALHDDLQAESDIDFLVTFENNECGSWMDKLSELEQSLSTLLNRNVDVVHRPGIEQSRNWIRRKAILDSAVVIYAA